MNSLDRDREVLTGVEKQCSSETLLHYPADMDWEKSLLDGITFLPVYTPKCRPGRITIHGSLGKPILIGAKEEDIVMAAAQFNKGRVVVFSHDSYGHDYNKPIGASSSTDVVAKLRENVKRWVSSDTFDGEACILYAKNVADKDKLKSCKILIYSGESHATLSTNDVIKFISKGGGFIHAVTPWGWLQLNPGKNLTDIPYWDVVLSTGGFAYTGDYINTAVQQQSIEGFSSASERAQK